MRKSATRFCGVHGVATTAMTVCLALATTVVSEATPFPVSGGNYTANVAFRVNKNGVQLSSVSGSLTNCSTQSGSAAAVVDYAFSPWAIMNIQDSNATAVIRVTLDSLYNLNKIRTLYGDYKPAEYEIRVSPDDSSWTTIASRRAPPPGLVTNDTFAAQDVKYIVWQVWGPGTTAGGPTLYAYEKELMAFVATNSPTAPQKEDGYNVAFLGSVISSDGWLSFAGAVYLIDHNTDTYGIRDTEGVPAHAVIDLGMSYRLVHLRLDFTYGQTWGGGGKFEISNDQTAWTSVVNTNGVLGSSTYSFAPEYARYIRVTNNGIGGGALGEILVFAVPPVHGTVILVK